MQVITKSFSLLAKLNYQREKYHLKYCYENSSAERLLSEVTQEGIFFNKSVK